jgi:hypothetical protein
MITIEYLQDYEGNKKGDRVKMLALPFIRLKKQRIVKRVGKLYEPLQKEVKKQPVKRVYKKKKK